MSVLKLSAQSVRALRWLKLPLWVLALATGAKSFKDNPVIGSARLNRAGLHISRMRLAHRLAAWRRRRLADGIDPADRAAFDRDGYIIKPDFLPAEVFASIQAELNGFRGHTREMLQGDTITRRIALDVDSLKQLPCTRGVLDGRPWRALLDYVGSYRLHPLHYVQIILSHVRDAAPDPQTTLHADTFHPTVKAWLFLTDVAEDEGPFVYVPGSHRLTKRRLAWERRRSIGAAQSDRLSARGSLRITPGEIDRLGYPAPRAFAVRGNTLVVADTSGFHARGPSVRPSVRIELWAYGRRNPFFPWTGWHLEGLPGLRGRIVPLYWRALDVMERCGITRNPWRPSTATIADSLQEHKNGNKK